MKLLRYGPKGQENPGTLDADGRIRDLSGVVADITPDQLWGEGLAALKAVDPETLPWWKASRATACRSTACANSSPSA